MRRRPQWPAGFDRSGSVRPCPFRRRRRRRARTTPTGSGPAPRSFPSALSLQVAARSVDQLDGCLRLANDLGLISSQDYEWLAGDVAEVKRLLALAAERLRADC